MKKYFNKINVTLIFSLLAICFYATAATITRTSYTNAPPTLIYGNNAGTLTEVQVDANGVVATGATLSGNVTANVTFPTTQNVNGTVAISNFPATQPVNGTVAVSNFPATQPVNGTVAVSNFPATQPVNGTVAVSNFPATQPVNGTVAVSSLSGRILLSYSNTANMAAAISDTTNFSNAVDISFITVHTTKALNSTGAVNVYLVPDNANYTTLLVTGNMNAASDFYFAPLGGAKLVSGSQMRVTLSNQADSGNTAWWTVGGEQIQ